MRVRGLAALHRNTYRPTDSIIKILNYFTPTRTKCQAYKRFVSKAVKSNYFFFISLYRAVRQSDSQQVLLRIRPKSAHSVFARTVYFRPRSKLGLFTNAPVKEDVQIEIINFKSAKTCQKTFMISRVLYMRESKLTVFCLSSFCFDECFVRPIPSIYLYSSGPSSKMSQQKLQYTRKTYENNGKR